MASGKWCEITEAVVCFIKVHSFCWMFKFLVYDHCPIPWILEADFLSFATAWFNYASCHQNFGTKPACKFDFGLWTFIGSITSCLPLRMSCQLVCHSLTLLPSHLWRLTTSWLAFQTCFLRKWGPSGVWSIIFTWQTTMFSNIHAPTSVLLQSFRSHRSWIKICWKRVQSEQAALTSRLAHPSYSPVSGEAYNGVTLSPTK